MKSKVEFVIREIRKDEHYILEDLLYESIYQTDKTKPIPRSVLTVPRVRAYIEDFGQKKDDLCLVAEINGRIIGAVWVRILSDGIKGFGNIDNQTPEFAIALFKEFRDLGIGTELMKCMISCLSEKGYKKASLSVQKENYATKLYLKLGFRIIDQNDEDYIMLLEL